MIKIRLDILMKLLSFSVLLSIVVAFAGLFAGTNQPYEKAPFEMPVIEIPVFKPDTINIINFGAVGDGLTKNTEAINHAIKVCSEQGGGTVLIPAGIWLTGPVQLKTNVNLHLEARAIMQFSSAFEDYPLIENTWEGLPAVRCIAPLSGFDLENIAITGEGIIDGAGDAWRPVKKFKMTDNQWEDLIQSGGVVDKKNKMWWPSGQAMNGADLVKKLNQKESVNIDEYKEAREYLRPVLINLVRCKKILLDGPTFQNSPAWNIHPLMCEDMVIRNINVRNPWYSQNGDGIDLESCKNVLLCNSTFDVGDDGICIKSGKDEFGRNRGRPSENIMINNCIVYHGHGGFTVGSEMSGGVRNISVSNCTFIGTDVGLRFKSTRGRGGIVENIFINNIYMTNIPTEAIRFNMFYDYSAPIPENGSGTLSPFLERKGAPVNDGTPIFRNINIQNIYCKGAEQAILIIGLPEMAIRQLNIENIKISANKGLIAVDTDGLSIKNVTLNTKTGPAYSFIQTRNLVFAAENLHDADRPQIEINGAKTANIRINSRDKNLKEKISISKDVPPKEIFID